MNRSLSMIVPANKQADCNAFMAALGKGPNTFSVPLSPGRAPVATHYGAHTYDDDLLAVLNGSLPTLDWAAFGLTATRAQQAKNAIRYRSFEAGNPHDNFGQLEAAEGAYRYETDEGLATGEPV